MRVFHCIVFQRNHEAFYTKLHCAIAMGFGGRRARKTIIMFLFWLQRRHDTKWIFCKHCSSVMKIGFNPNGQATQSREKQVFEVINWFLFTIFTFDYSFKQEQDLLPNINKCTTRAAEELLIWWLLSLAHSPQKLIILPLRFLWKFHCCCVQREKVFSFHFVDAKNNK